MEVVTDVQQLARKMGWTVTDKEVVLDKYIKSRPENIDLSDEDILKELNAIRQYHEVKDNNRESPEGTNCG